MLELLSGFKSVWICHRYSINLHYIWEPVDSEGSEEGSAWDFIVLNREAIQSSEYF